jgi:hypothetical protein
MERSASLTGSSSIERFDEGRWRDVEREVNMSGYLFTTERWPLIVVTLAAAPTDEEHDQLFRDWEGVLARREKFAAITDLRSVRSVGGARQRARIAEWTRSVEQAVARYSLGHATVIKSALVRGALTAISWLHQSPAPQTYVATMLEGCDYCVEKLETHRVPVPETIRHYRAHLAKEAA